MSHFIFELLRNTHSFLRIILRVVNKTFPKFRILEKLVFINWDKHFTQTNEYLVSMGKTPIDW
jgi:hypothetical protein